MIATYKRDNSSRTSMDQHGLNSKPVWAKTKSPINSRHSEKIVFILKEYQPLFVLILLSIIISSVLFYRPIGGERNFMPLLMGMLLSLFAMLKLFDLKGFRLAFSEYDLVSTRWPSYGYWYPFLELLLGVGFLSGYALGILSFLTILIMSVTAVGIFLALVKQKDISCACTGSLIQIPLSSISLIESIGMMLMAIVSFVQEV